MPINIKFMDVRNRDPDLEQLFQSTNNGERRGSIDEIFPITIAELIHDLLIKANHVYRSYSTVCSEINRIPMIIQERYSEWEDQMKDVLSGKVSSRDGCQQYRILFEHLGLWHAVEIYLFELKSFLDHLARIFGRLMGIKNVHSFETKRIKEDGKQKYLAGENFIKILEQKAPDYARKMVKQISSLILQHREIWLNEMVRQRDTVTHYGTLQTIITLDSGVLRVPIDRVPISITMGKQPLVESMERLHKGYSDFLKASLCLLRDGRSISDISE